MNSRRSFAVYSCVVCLTAMTALMASSAVADPIFTIEAVSALKASRLVNIGGELDDIRGAALVDVSNPTLLGTISIFDPSGILPQPDFTQLASGNSTLLGSNQPVFTQETLVAINLTSGIVGPGSLKLFGVGVPVTTITDPALAATIGNLEFDFRLFETAGPDPSGNTLYSYELSSIETVPEPGLVLLLASAVALIVCIAARRARVAR